MNSEENVKISLVNDHCISLDNSSFTIIVRNIGKQPIVVNKNEFLLFSIKNEERNYIDSKVLYDPTIESSEKVITIQEAEELEMTLESGDLQYYDLKIGERYLFTLKYLNNKGFKSSGVSGQNISIKSDYAQVCK